METIDYIFITLTILHIGALVVMLRKLFTHVHEKTLFTFLCRVYVFIVIWLVTNYTTFYLGLRYQRHATPRETNEFIFTDIESEAKTRLNFILLWSAIVWQCLLLASLSIIKHFYY